MKEAMQRLAALPAGERLRLLLMMLALPSVSLSLRVLGYVRTVRLVEWLSRRPRRSAGDDDLREAEALAQLVAVASRRRFVQATCLRQAVLVHGLLRRRGLQPELKLGVRREGDDIEAHAWVELEGQALAQQRLDYSPFADRTRSG